MTAAERGVDGFVLGRLPRITYGAGSSGGLAGIVGRYGRHALVITGRSFSGSPRWTGLADGLAAAGVTLDHELAAGEPSPDAVDAILARRRGTGVDVVLGIGGGSALDTAKAVAGLLETASAARDHLEGLPGSVPYPGPALPWIAVPTTAGTGSEATRNAVLSGRDPAPFKRSFRDERLVAAEAIVDPDLLAGVPPAVIAGNGADAVTQLLEGYTTRRATPVTDALALDGLARAAWALPAWHAAASAGSDDADARAAMAYAALLGGVVLANAGLGVVHGIVSVVGAHTDAPHGAGCGALLVAGVAANIAALEARAPDHPVLARYAALGRLFAGDGADGGSARRDDAADRAALVARLRDLVDRLALPNLAAYGLADSAIPSIARESLGASSMRANPIDLTEAEVAEVLRASR